jgi:hypothetical protein
MYSQGNYQLRKYYLYCDQFCRYFEHHYKFYFVFLNTQHSQEQIIEVEYRYVEQVAEWQAMHVIGININFECFCYLMVVSIGIYGYY